MPPTTFPVEIIAPTILQLVGITVPQGKKERSLHLKSSKREPFHDAVEQLKDVAKLVRQSVNPKQYFVKL